jgi:hypothetical protein
MPKTFTFPNKKALSRANNCRAYADVQATDAAGSVKSPILICLVDSGSDFTILPASAASAVGIAVSSLTQVASFSSPGGPRYMLPLDPSVRLVVEGYAITVPVAFSSSPSFIPILGRNEMLAAFDAGFDNTDWYWG